MQREKQIYSFQEIHYFPNKIQSVEEYNLFSSLDKNNYFQSFFHNSISYYGINIQNNGVLSMFIYLLIYFTIEEFFKISHK